MLHHAPEAYANSFRHGFRGTQIGSHGCTERRFERVHVGFPTFNIMIKWDIYRLANLAY